MALIDVTLKLSDQLLLEELPLPQRLAALRGLEPHLVPLVERFAERSVRRRYSVAAVSCAARLVADITVLDAAIATESRSSAQSAMLASRSLHDRLAAKQPERRSPSHTVLELQAELRSITPASSRFRPLLHRMKNRPVLFAAVDVTALYDRLENEPVARCDLAVAAAEIVDHATLDRVLDDIDSGRTATPTGRDLWRLVLAWRAPLDQRLCRHLAVTADTEDVMSASTVREWIERCSVTDDGRQAFTDAGRFDLLLASGVPVTEVCEMALRGADHSWPALLNVARVPELQLLAEPILTAASTTGGAVGMKAWGAAAERVLTLLRAVTHRDTLRRALHFVDARRVVETLCDATLGWTQDERLEIIEELLVSGAKVPPADLLRRAVEELPSEHECAAVANLVFTHGAGVLHERNLVSAAGRWYAEYLAARLGEDEMRWRLYFQLSGGFTGTVAELLEVVDASLATPAPTAR